MTIKVYPSLLPGEPIESHDWEGSLADWLEEKGINYIEKDRQPIQVSQNGKPVPVSEWGNTYGDIDIRLLPSGGLLEGLGSILGKIFNAVFGWLMPGGGGQGPNETPQGQKLEVTTAKANQPRLGEVVPELAGRFRRFPDYLNQPRRYFANMREQILEFHACIGPGRYWIDDSDVKVGDTPFSGLGADGSYQIFEPGADLSGVSTHENWYTVTEVGGTSSGTAGLELPVDNAAVDNVDPAEYSITGNTLVRSSGSFPAGWGEGTTVFVEYPRIYDVVTISVPATETEPEYDISEITGYFGHLEPFDVGDIITFGPLDGQIDLKVQTKVGNSVRFLEQWDDNVPSNFTPFLIPEGSQSLIFGALIFRGITSFSEDTISVTAGAFQTGTAGDVRVRFAGGLVYGEWTSTFAACPSSELTGLIELDFFFPGGLAEIEGDGTLVARTIRTEIQYRDMNAGGAFTSLVKVYTEATLDQIGFTERIFVTPMRPEVRVRRVGAEANSTQIQDKLHWYGLKSRLPTVTSYPNWTTMSAQVRSGGKLAAQSENQINVVATRILPELQADGTWSAPIPTRDISAFAKYITTTIWYTDDNLRMDEWVRLNNTWKSRGDTLDYIYEETVVRNALNTAFGAGMAELTVDDGQIRPARDEVRTQFEQAYSPQNMKRPMRRAFTSPQPDDSDGVEVEYIDQDTWTKQTVRCLLPGDMAFKLEKIKLDGVTSRTRAWRIGMRRRRALKYRRWNYSFSTELDALNSGYLSYVPLYDDIPGYGKSAILVAIEDMGGGVALLHSSEPLEWESGASHVIGYRRPDGTLAGPYAATKGDTEYEVIATLPTPWPVVTLRQEPPYIFFGTADRWEFPALITQISPQGIENVAVSAINYDSRVYADDNNSPSE